MSDETLSGSFSVVIDVLRFTTVVAHALANGCEGVLPLPSIERALAVRAEMPGVLLGGERGGAKISGFDLANSPCEYSKEKVGGRMVAVTTTNGTVALLRCRGLAARVTTGSFVNLRGVCDLAVKAYREDGVKVSIV